MPKKFFARKGSESIEDLCSNQDGNEVQNKGEAFVFVEVKKDANGNGNFKTPELLVFLH
jgi:hypothetical protein